MHASTIIPEMSIFSCEREIIAWEDYRIIINNTHSVSRLFGFKS